MQLRKKVNYKMYFSLSAALLLASFGFCRNLTEYISSVIIFLAVVLNQWILLSSVDQMVKDTMGNKEFNNKKLLYSLLFKVIILVIALSFGVHFMGNRIIIPLMIYVAQIFVLYFSLMKNSKD